MQMEPGSENSLLSSSGDGSLSIWDIRKLGPKAKPLASHQHSKTCNSAYWSPTGACACSPCLPCPCLDSGKLACKLHTSQMSTHSARPKAKPLASHQSATSTSWSAGGTPRRATPPTGLPLVRAHAHHVCLALALTQGSQPVNCIPVT